MDFDPNTKFGAFGYALSDLGYCLHPLSKEPIKPDTLRLYDVRPLHEGTPPAATKSIVIRHLPGGDYRIFAERSPEIFDAKRIAEGVPADIKESLLDGLMAYRDEFDAKHEAFNDYSPEDVATARGKQAEATAWIENEK